MITSAILEKAVPLTMEGVEQRLEFMKFHSELSEAVRNCSEQVRTAIVAVQESLVRNSIAVLNQDGSGEPSRSEVIEKQALALAAVQQFIYFGYRLHSLELMEGLDASS